MSVGLDKYLRAKTLLHQSSVRLTHARLDLDRPLLFFEINNGEVHVQYNHKGWLSDYVEPDDDYILRCARAIRAGKERPMRWMSGYSSKVEDFNILACKMWLRRNKEAIALNIRSDRVIEKAISGAK